MPTLRLKNFRILQVEGDEHKQNVGTYYIRADVYDPKNGLSDYGSRNFFIPRMTQAVRDCFPANGTYMDIDNNNQSVERPWNGTRTDIPANATRDEMEKAIPIEFKRIKNAEFEPCSLGGEFARRRGRAGFDREGNAFNAEDFILDGDGTLSIYTTQSVLVSKDYTWVNALDANGNLIPNPKYDPNDPDCLEEEWLQTVVKDSYGVPVLKPIKGWEPEPQVANIKRAFCVSIEKACEECIANGHPERIPYAYRDKYPQAFANGAAQQPPVGQTAQPAPAQAGQPQQQANPNPAPAQTGQPGTTVNPPF